MDIGSSKVAFGLSFKLIDDMLQAFHQHNAFPQQVSFDHQVDITGGIATTLHVIADIQPPRYSLQQDGSAAPYGRLDLRGTVRLRATLAGQDSPDIFVFPLHAAVRLSPVLKPVAGKAPLVALHYQGVEQVSQPLNVGFIDVLMASPTITGILDQLAFDVITPIIESLETTYFFLTPASDRPAHDAYPVQLRLMQAQPGHTACIGLLVDLPGSAPNTHFLASIVPDKAEVMMYISPAMVQALVDHGKSELQAWIASSANNLKINRLSLSIQDNRIAIDAKIVETETDTEITVSGGFGIRHLLGTTTLVLDGAELDIDIDYPWWIDLLTPFLFPLMWGVDSLVETVEQNAPNLAQKTAQRLLDNTLGKLSLQNLSVANVPFEVYPDTVVLDGNAITMHVQVLFQPLTEPLAKADYSPLIDRFVMYHLTSGRKYFARDLARLMQQGMVIVPGYHQVAGRYLRSNPDTTEANNLLTRFER